MLIDEDRIAVGIDDHEAARAAATLFGTRRELQPRDDPEIVPLEKCRYDVGLEIPASVSVGGEVSVTSFPALTVAELEVKGSIALEMRAIDWRFTTWLPTSGFAPANQPAFEVWNGAPFAVTLAGCGRPPLGAEHLGRVTRCVR